MGAVDDLPFSDLKLGAVTGAGGGTIGSAVGTAAGAVVDGEVIDEGEAVSGTPTVVGTAVVVGPKDGGAGIVGAAVVGATAVRNGPLIGVPRNVFAGAWPDARGVAMSADAKMKKTQQTGRAAHRSGVIISSSMNESTCRRSPCAGSKVAEV